jgi:hypothetical protein
MAALTSDGLPSVRRKDANMIATRLCTAAFIGMIMSGPSNAGEDSEKKPIYSYFVVESPALVLLEQIAHDAGKNLQVEDGGGGVRAVTASRLDGSLDEIFGQITASRDLVFFDYNETIFVSRRANMMTRVIAHSGRNADDVRRVLLGAGLDVEKFAFREGATDRTIVVTAPVQFLAVAESLIGTMVPTINVRRGIEITDQ